LKAKIMDIGSSGIFSNLAGLWVSSNMDDSDVVSIADPSLNFLDKL